MDALTRLQHIYFFDSLTPEDFAALAGICHLQHFGASEDILTQGEVTSCFFIVDEGYVGLIETTKDGLEKALTSKFPGDFFGIKMFTTQALSDYTFKAIDGASVWVIERKDWDQLLVKHGDILMHMPELRKEFTRLTRGLDWLAPGEVIDLVTRRHWFALLLMMRVPLALGLVFGFAFFISWQLGVLSRLPNSIYAFIAALGFFFIWAVWSGVNWFNDTYIVTNKRVIRINRFLFLSDSSQEIPIEKIQAEKVQRGGPISVLLNISDLQITSAAANMPGLVFVQVGNVKRIQKSIELQKSRVKQRDLALARRRLRNQIQQDIRHHMLPHTEVPEPPPTLKRVPFTSRVGETWSELFGTQVRHSSEVTWRKHYVILLQQIGPPLLALSAVILFAIFIALAGLPFKLSATGIYAVLLVLGLGALGAILWQWEDWRLDLYTLTDSEIIDVESRPFGLGYSEKRAQLKNIQDITTARPSFVNVMLDYGNVNTRVAGSAGPFTFTSVAHPKEVADELQNRLALRKFRDEATDRREQSQRMIDGLIAYHDVLNSTRLQDLNNGITSIALPPPAPAPIILPPAPPPDQENEFPPESEVE